MAAATEVGAPARTPTHRHGHKRKFVAPANGWASARARLNCLMQIVGGPSGSGRGENHFAKEQRAQARQICLQFAPEQKGDAQQEGRPLATLSSSASCTSSPLASGKVQFACSQPLSLPACLPECLLA